MKSFGNTKQNLFINVGVNILNVIGNGMFIFGWFGAPVLGATGVGISTVFSKFIGCIVAVFVMKHYYNFKFDIRLYKPIRFKIIKNILGVGFYSWRECSMEYRTASCYVHGKYYGNSKYYCKNIPYAYINSYYDIFNSCRTWFCYSCRASCGSSIIREKLMTLQ